MTRSVYKIMLFKHDSLVLLIFGAKIMIVIWNRFDLLTRNLNGTENRLF